MARMGLAARGRRRPPTGRQEEIARVGRAARVKGGGPGQGKVNPQGVGMMNPPGQGNGKRFNPKTDIQQGLGRQLSRRVATGAITEKQARRTAGERQSLKAAYGDDWRNKVFGGQGKIAQARQMLAKNPGNAKLIALNKRLQGQRQDAVQAARQKIQGGGGTEAPGNSGNAPAIGKRRRAAGEPVPGRGRGRGRGRSLMPPGIRLLDNRRRRTGGGY